MSDNQKLPYYIECGCCGHFHEPEYYGECRDDDHRFTWDELDARHGENGWDYKDIEEQMQEEGEASHTLGTP